MRKITVDYTGSYPVLCHGVWKISIGDTELPEFGGEMGTRKEYRGWSFDDDYNEVFHSYTCGKELEGWLFSEEIKPLSEALEKVGLALSSEEWEELYEKIREKDFRHGSCGGCI